MPPTVGDIPTCQRSPPQLHSVYSKAESTMPIPDYQSLMLPVLEVASKDETSAH